MFRRHPIILTLISTVLIGATALAWFILTFDLNRYRRQLELSLSKALSQPVSLGKAAFSLRHGPAFDFADLRIGSDEESGFLLADHLLIKPELEPLMEGRLSFSKVRLEGPLLRIVFHPPQPREGPPAGSPSPWWNKLAGAPLIRFLTVENGRLQILDRRDPERPYLWAFDNLHGGIRDLSPGRSGNIHLSGTLAQGERKSPFELEGNLTPAAQISRLSESSAELNLSLEGFSPGPLLERYIPTKDHAGVAGEFDLQLELTGSPADGLRSRGELTGKGLTLQLPRSHRTPLHLGRVAFSGTWQKKGNGQRFSGLFLEVNGLKFSGELQREIRDGRPLWEGTLSSGEISWPDLIRYLPDIPSSTLPMGLAEFVPQGRLRLESARFAGPAALFRLPSLGHVIQEAVFRVDGGVVRLSGRELKAVTGEMRLKGDRLHLTGGHAEFQGNPIEFSGTLDRPFAENRTLVLEMGGTLDAEPLMGLIPKDRATGLVCKGSAPIRLSLNGPLPRLQLDMQADLKFLALQVGGHFSKPAGLEGSLFLTGKLVEKRFELTHGRLRLPSLELRARGHWEGGTEASYSLILDLSELNLEKARFRFPLLEKLRTRGTVAVHYELAGGEGGLLRQGGTVSLRDVGLHLTPAIADLNGVNGEILLGEGRLDIERLGARIGSSPVKIDGSLTNFADPQFDLSVHAKAIRANDLIFHSDRTYLRDVEGRLLIDRGGIRFEPVKVRLDGGTRAEVRGGVLFQGPVVHLDISADYGNIDEVIALWKGTAPDRGGPLPKKAAGEMRIVARVAQGELGPLPFQRAEGEITRRNGVLVIHPLRFRSGPGLCVGQVAVDGRQGPPSRLKISGHLENFQSETVFLELLKRRGLVTGTLHGDFYLEGTVGKDFLPSSAGGFHLQVEEGVLRKFSWLSKVFSLLNVSQVLTFKLPEMAQEGMPFHRLSGTIILKNGVLSSEDLFIDSNAMNLTLVGDLDLVKDNVDLVMGVKPLGTVDKIVTKIPLAGWVLTGEEKALITAQFLVRGATGNPEVRPAPIDTVSNKVIGIFQRMLGLPGRVIEQLGSSEEGDGKP